jgi:hypothetical protein
MMKKLPVLLVIAVVCARSAFAQTAPVAGEKGRFAAAFDAGVTFPFGAGYDPGWTVNGSFDYYLSHLFAIRGTAGYESSSTSFTDSFTRASFLASGVWQFDRGALRPYGRIGVGVYAISPPVGATRARVGVHAGGGVEWFFNPRTSLTGDAVVHLLPDTEDRSTSSVDVTLGLRHYF